MALASALLAAAIPAAGCASHGRDLFLREGCAQCHHFRDIRGGGLAPDLTNVASRRDAAAIRAQITNPGAGNPASRMPPFKHLSWYDLRSLIAFLQS